MIVSNLLTPDVVQFIKIIAILIALVHLFAGFILTFQTMRMNRILKTSNGTFFDLIGVMYIGILVFTLILIISA